MSAGHGAVERPTLQGGICNYIRIDRFEEYCAGVIRIYEYDDG